MKRTLAKPRCAVVAVLFAVGCTRDWAIPASTGTLTGRVVEAIAGTDQVQPVAGADVSLGGSNLVVSSDKDGTFAFVSIPARRYQVQVRAVSAAGSVRQRLLGEIRVQGGVQTGLGDVAVKQNAQLAGRVLKEGHPLGNAGITVYVPGKSYATTTSDLGTWLLRDLPEGTLRASASLSGYLTASTSDLAVQGGTVTSAVDLVLTKETSQLKGGIQGAVLVLDPSTSSGAASSSKDVSVRVQSVTQAASVFATTTDASGSFTFGGLPPDLYTLTAEKIGLPVARVANLSVAAGVQLVLADPILLGSAGGNQPNAQCTTASQCDPGRLCTAGGCADCASDQQCGAGVSCRSGRCVRDCSSNAECGAGVCSGGRCRPCLTGSNECADPALVCDASGSCVHCQDRLQCAPGQACLAGGCGACGADGDCGAGAVCESGTCVSGSCASNDGCPLAQACVGNQCVACSADAQCRSGQVCVGSGACVAGDCRTSDQCNGGKICSGFQCGPCAGDGDCGAGRLCLPTALGPRCGNGDCRASSDCKNSKAGQVCIGNTCTDCGRASGIGCATGQVCAPQAGSAQRCVSGNCVQPSDCAGSETGWLCTANHCTPCLVDQDCAGLGTNLICDLGGCAPAQCAVRADCAGPNLGKVCRSQRCAACAPGDCAAGEACTGGLCVAVNLHSVTVSGGAGGTVTSNPGTISCNGGSGICSGVYTLGDVVVLTAAPAAGFFFGGWSGVANCGAAPACSLVVTGDVTVSATFNAGATLAVAAVGSGTITSSPAGLSCPGTCSSVFAIGAGVTLSATAVTGWSFAGWSGGGCGGTGSCAVTIAQPTTVTATFVKQPVLTLAPGGSGAGTITSSPAGLTCATGAGGVTGQCSAPFASGTKVTLTAAPAGVPFGGWLSGGCSGTLTTCTVTLIADDTVGAAFGAAFALGLAVTGPGAVSADSGALSNCSASGGSCSASYASGTVVNLAATPTPGAALGAWGGDCSANTGPTCTLSMSQARTASATFTAVTTITLVQGDQQSAPATSLLPGSVILKVADSTGKALVGAPVTLAGPAGAVVTPAVANTDGSGHAIFGIRLAPTVGLQTFTAATPTAQAALMVTATSAQPAAGVITTMVNTDYTAGGSGIPGPGLAARINSPTGLALAKDGTLYVAGYNNNQIFAYSPAGVLTVVAGTGACGYTGDNQPAAAAQLCNPTEIALDETNARKTLYFIQSASIRAIDLLQSPPIISTFAGGGTAPSPGYGDGGPATSAALNGPRHIAVGPTGDYLYIVDSNINHIRRVDLTMQTITTWLVVPIVVDSRVSCGNAYNLGTDCLLAFDANHTPYLGYQPTAAWGNNNPPMVVSRVNPDLSLTAVAGGGPSGGEGAPALGAALHWTLNKLLFDGAGNLYLEEGGLHRLRRVEAGTGRINTVVGTGTAGAAGDFGDALQAQLRSPWSALFDANQDLLISDSGNSAIRRVWTVGASAPAWATLTAVSGTPQSVVVDQAAAAPFLLKLLDPAGQPLVGYPIAWSVVDPGGAFIGVTSTDLTGMATATVQTGLAAGSAYHFAAAYTALTGPVPTSPATFTLNTTAPAPGSMFSIVDIDHAAGGTGYPGAATRAHVNLPTAAVSAKDGTLYFAGFGNNQVFALAPSGQLTAIVGTGTCGHAGDNGPATAAQVCSVSELALDETKGRKKLYILDQDTLVRVVDLTASVPSIATFAGGGSMADGSPAATAALNGPRHIALGPAGDYLYIVDSNINEIRRVDLVTAIINNWLRVPIVVDPRVSCGNAYNLGTDCLLAFDANHTPYLGYQPTAAWGNNNPPMVISRVNADLSLTPVAGGGANGGEGVAALSAVINWTLDDLYFSSTGDLYYAERLLHRVRKVSNLATSPTISTVIGTGVAGNGADFLAPLGTALNAPSSIAILPDGKLVVADSGNHTIRAIWPPAP